MSPAPKPRVYLTTERIAEISGIEPSTFENMRYRRQGPPFTKIGGAVRYEEALFYAWLDDRTIHPLPDAEGDMPKASGM